MTKVVVTVENDEQAKLLLEMLKNVDFVLQVESDLDSLPVADIVNHDAIEDEEPNFFSLIGMWKDRDISAEELRKQAWRRS